MSGQLYKFIHNKVEEVEPNFCFVVDEKINNKADWWDRYQGIRNKNSLVMHVKDFDLTKETTTTISTSMESMMASAAATGMPPPYDYYEKACKEWNVTGKISGGIFLTVNDSKMIWISNADLKYFEKVV